ncbi:MAG TPA: family 20 glycosylhydrolase [Gemmatimonadaceae bacterium]
MDDLHFSVRRWATIITTLAALAAMASCVSLRGRAADTSEGPVAAVIPLPRHVAPGAGAWVPRDEIVVTIAGPQGAALEELDGLARLGAEMTGALLGRRATSARATAGATGDIRIRIEDGGTGGSPESYRLTIAPGGVDISAPAPAGAFYGLQTLRQLLEAATTDPAQPPRRIPAVVIDDAPRFRWRGLHLDVGRHFFPVSFVKRYIDLMARFKLNTFHWHLTEDQGWRIEIKSFPRLTSVASCRRETMVEKHFDPYVGDGVRYCGFYTQVEIREVVAYARERYVTIVPEIEMPGHSKAALAAYPELACTPGPFEVRTTWGVDEDIYCPSEETFRFLERVLDEVIALFPGTYIHIGGDEAPKARWQASAVAQEVIRREGLKDEHELQSWFIRRIERFLLSRGRRLIGWDEILEGGLAPEATVMSWRGTSGGIEAARQGHDVIMTPTSHLYFDYYQGDARFEPLAIGGFVPLEQVYAFEPVPEALTPAQAQHVLGAQGNVWTEYLKTPEAVEYMAWPRALALAEVVWTPREARDWDSFASRLPVALRSLDRLAVQYRVPHAQGLEGDRLTLRDRITIRLRSLLPSAEIRYTTDGSDPTPASARYDGPFTIPVSFDGTVVTARVFTTNGRASPPRAARFTRTTYRQADAVPAEALVPGLRYQYFEASVRRVAAIDTLRPQREGVVSAIARRGDETAERYALRFTGLLRIPTDGLYEFALASDDGSTLEIGGRVVVDNDGLHGTEERTGMIALRQGVHPVTLRYFQGGGGASLSLRVRTGDGPWEPVPADWLVHRR